ncbi:AtpZ/AtpI family protein [Chryseosolibacter indicus]|uniref:AtpZ/AtpI family protein n=1 Tax=Chryseosolibacter indicus TaxID=2782351 RepID=A0ABS5VMJ4_9BACT|nr:AtpZ/AtpI family protein [Chryseosolibacter indicus]MBT1702669.1 AtpZ/AtpI family protein [Chryseosolibacter indicus]
MEQSQDPSRRKKLNQYNSYLKYSGLAIQLLAAIALCGWVGHFIDKWLNYKYPVFMLILGFVGFGGMLYQIYKSINDQ